MSAHEGVKCLCNQCNSIFASKSNHEMHKISMHEAVKHQCNLCDLIFSQQGYLMQHKVAIHESVKYLCYAKWECSIHF